MAKKVRDWNSKQKLSKNQSAIITEKLSDVGKDSIITPEQIKLQDVVFDEGKKNKKRVEPTQEGKIITEDQLKKEASELEKKNKEESLKFEKEFNKQLKEWSKEDLSDEYSFVDISRQEYLVRIFEMDVSDFDGHITLNYEWSALLNQYKIADARMNKKTFPIVKIIKVGRDSDDGFKKGDIVLVPSTDILGDDWNPKFLHIMQYQQSSNMKPVLPEGMRQRISNVEIKWDKYRFVKPWVLDPQNQDTLTYLIPQSKVKGYFNVSN